MERPQILFEDEHLMVINKPSGWVVNNAYTVKGDTPTIQTWLKNNFDFETSQLKNERSGLVHRLDKETSGCLIIAKTKSDLTKLQKQFKKRLVKKTYLALVHGQIDDGGIINAPVGRLPWNRQRFGVLAQGRKATTEYQRLNLFSLAGNKFSLVEFYPQTGRTHQIRIHAKYLGHPLVADSFYAGRKTARKDHLWCKRLFLHALWIEFKHPQNRKTIKVKSRLPEDLQQALDHLQEG